MSEPEEPEKESWKWRYSALTGVMYGPVPVGIIIFVFFVIIYLATQ
jgi:hypothetical protein